MSLLLRPRLPLPRFSRTFASVSPPTLSEVLGGSAPHASGSTASLTPAQRARRANLSPQELTAEIELQRARKLKEYEDRMRIKAMEQGLSLDELKAQARERAAASAAASRAAHADVTAEQRAKMSAIEERDMRVAAEIRERAEKEARRKLESGELGSGPGGRGSVKPLSQILDLQRVASQDAATISELWTGYHSLKNKLSAVIPVELYRDMFARGQRFPQFVLPLPRTITAAEEADELLPPEKKQGYEMHLCEWAALPPPPVLPFLDEASSTQQGPAPRPSTVLFTPLAEYKLRQEFAQPLLVLTHYTDLAASKGIVLMRGDLTAHENASAAPTGFAAAAAAAARGASEEEQAKLKAPLQAEAKMTQQDAQLLVVALQRFYMPPTTKAGEEGAETRAKLLADFHERPEEFDLAQLCKAAFLLS